MNEELQLANAFEKAAKLYAVLGEWHPQNSDKIRQTIDQIQDDPARVKNLELLQNYLEKYTLEEEGKPSRRWSSQENFINHVSRRFVEINGEAPATHLQLMNFLIAAIQDDFKDIFNKNAKPKEASYENVFARVTRRHTEKGIDLPAHVKMLHDFTYGDLSILKRWMTTPQGLPSSQSFGDKFLQFVESQQLHAVSKLVKRMDPYGDGHILYARACQVRRDADLKTGEAHSFLPIEFKDHMTQQEIISSVRLSQLARNMDLPLAMVIGIEPAFTNKDIAQNFDLEIYKKIRNFLSHEYDNVLELNRASSLMTLIFNDYTMFTNYVVKKAAYDPETGGIGLKSLIDISSFNFDNVNFNYNEWADDLIEHGPDMFFYIKAMPLLETIPRNHLNKILISQLNLQLYNQIAEVLNHVSKDDVARYASLKIVDNIDTILKAKEEYLESTKGKTDKTIGIPEMRVDLPDGSSFARLSYNDDRFFIVGRLTRSCEYLEGHWGDAVKQAFNSRTSTYYCLFDPDGRVLAHTRVYRDAETFNIIFDGFEADQNEVRVTKEILVDIVEEIKKQYPDEKFIVGSSVSFLKYEEVPTIKRGEENPLHKKVIDPNEIFDAQRMVESAVLPEGHFIHVNPSDDDSEELQSSDRVIPQIPRIPTP